MFVQIVRLLQNHRLLAQAALMVVTVIGFLHLGVFFVGEIVDVVHKIGKLFS